MKHDDLEKQLMALRPKTLPPLKKRQILAVLQSKAEELDTSPQRPKFLLRWSAAATILFCLSFWSHYETRTLYSDYNIGNLASEAVASPGETVANPSTSNIGEIVLAERKKFISFARKTATSQMLQSRLYLK